MTAFFPGQPRSKLQGVTTGFWNGRQYNAYITGHAISIIDGVERLLQTIYHDDSDVHADAIAIDEVSGKIATCTWRHVRIYKPLVFLDGSIKWAQQSVFDNPHATPETTSWLSWGGLEELIVASSHLCLFTTEPHPTKIWERILPNPAKSAVLSHDAAYVASIGQHDHLVKIWRRLTYSTDEVKFDVTLLQHPAIVALIRWRRSQQSDQPTDNVLYTICVSGLVHIWVPVEATEGRHWCLQACVDTSATAHVSGNPNTVLVMIDGRDFYAALDSASRGRMTGNQNATDGTPENSAARSKKYTDLCVNIDGIGMVSAWAIANVETDNLNTIRTYSIARGKMPEKREIEKFLKSSGTGSHTEAQAYCDYTIGRLFVLLHSFDGRIGVFAADVADLINPSSASYGLSFRTVWTGHTEPIRKLTRNFSGHAVVSQTNGAECILWRYSGMDDRRLTRSAVIPDAGSAERICLLRKGRFVVFHCGSELVLWDCRLETALAIARRKLEGLGSPLCLILLPRPRAIGYQTAHVATIFPSGKGIVCEVRLPRYLAKAADNDTATITEFCRFDLEAPDDLKLILPVDPAGAAPSESGFLDKFARDVAISCTHKGRVDFWAARVNVEAQGVDWLSTSYTNTSVASPAQVSGCMLKKAAVVDSTRSQLTIWDIGGARLEFENNYGAHDTVQDMDWTSTPDSQAILAVGFQHRVLLMSQMRFDYLNKGPAWATVHEISIRELTTHSIGDSAWLANGHLIIGAGNQLFVHDRRISVTHSVMNNLRFPHKDGSDDLFQVVQRFNGPLPSFHPQLLSQCVLAGKGPLVRCILSALYRTLQHLGPGDYIDDYLGLPMSTFYMPDERMICSETRETEKVLTPDHHSYEEKDVFNQEMAAAVNEKLTRLRIPQLTGQEQIQLADIVECVAVVERHRRSMDENGTRFMLFSRQHTLRKGRVSETRLSWREINWAFHSNSQDILLDFVSRQNHGAVLWEQAQECGVFMWLSDSARVRDYFEIIARNEYTKGDPKDPVDCSLFYLALRKKTMLQGLWRMANWNKEQLATQKLLANDFEDPKWRRTALKNAYALLSKRRFHYAAAFFLLADHLEDAVDVCLRQLKDLQLAIAIARVYEGDGGPVLRKIIQDEILRVAAEEGDRWLASWAFWMLGRKDMAVRALIMPVFALLDMPSFFDIKSRSFLTDDPALVVLYSQLRQQTLQTLRGASKITPKVEWEFVLHSAKLYDRMGCDLLGLSLVRNWEFQRPIYMGIGNSYPLKLLRRRSSLVVDDMSSAKRNQDSRSVPDNCGNPSNDGSFFVEPDAMSLLDNFGL